MTDKVTAILDDFKRTHPEAVNVKITAVTRHQVFIKFDSKRLAHGGLFVGTFNKTKA